MNIYIVKLVKSHYQILRNEFFRFGRSISKFDVDHYTAWNMIFKEVTNIEVDKTMSYLLEGIMRGNELVKKY